MLFYVHIKTVFSVHLSVHVFVVHVLVVHVFVVHVFVHVLVVHVFVVHVFVHVFIECCPVLAPQMGGVRVGLSEWLLVLLSYKRH